MKILLAAVFVFIATAGFAAVSIDEIVKLSSLNTSDDVILQLIQKEGLEKPVTSKDVLHLKENGVSDRVIQYCVKLSDQDPQKLPKQQGKSEYLNENLRAYTTTNKDGKKIRVITNLDESGKRMGEPVPPDPEPQQQPAPLYEAPPEHYAQRDAYPERHYEEPYYPEFVDDRYQMPPYPYGGGYPLIDPYFFPSLPLYPVPDQGRFDPHRPYSPDVNWSSNAGYSGRHQRQRQRETATSSRSSSSSRQRSASQGARPRRTR